MFSKQFKTKFVIHTKLGRTFNGKIFEDTFDSVQLKDSFNYIWLKSGSYSKNDVKSYQLYNDPLTERTVPRKNFNVWIEEIGAFKNIDYFYKWLEKFLSHHGDNIVVNDDKQIDIKPIK